MDDETRQQVALWRLGVLGPLMSARLEHGDVRGYVREAATRVHRMPESDDSDSISSAATSRCLHTYEHSNFKGTKWDFFCGNASPSFQAGTTGFRP